MYAGSTASLTVLGAPDLIVLTLTEFADQARRICRAVKRLPLLVDADHGYGNALNAMRTCEEMENCRRRRHDAGGHGPAAALWRRQGDADLAWRKAWAKVRAALAARDDPSFVHRRPQRRRLGERRRRMRWRAPRPTRPVRRRCAVLHRASGPARSCDAVAAVATLPIIVGGVEGTEINDKAYLAARGVRVALQGHQPIMAAQQRRLRDAEGAARRRAAIGRCRACRPDDLMGARHARGRLQALDQGLPGRMRKRIP